MTVCARPSSLPAAGAPLASSGGVAATPPGDVLFRVSWSWRLLLAVSVVVLAAVPVSAVSAGSPTTTTTTVPTTTTTVPTTTTTTVAPTTTTVAPTTTTTTTIVVTTTTVASEALPSWMPNDDYFVGGAVSAMLVIVLGYTVAPRFRREV